MAPSMSVAEYYANKTIFITGATGFMGKVLVEKLLRSCPDVKRIYMLMRGKKGQSSGERLESFLKCRIFDRLHEVSPKCFEKLRLIPGDILAEGMGISEEHRQELRNETQIIFHCAACVRFDMPLKDATALNTGGTQRVLDLTDGMSQLEVFVHVSTAYCRCELPVLEERVYETKHRPQEVMKCVEWMDDELITHLQPKLIDPQPNTYAYTKSLAESLVAQYEGKFPIAIARPSIVTAAHKEPMPGWVDNLNGPTGLLVGAGKGVIRTMHCNDALKADVIPVDFVVNGCILVAYNTGVNKPKEVQVVNITESGRNPLTWGAALDMGRIHVQEFPFSVCLWYPGGSPKSSLVLHQIALLFTHIIPAYLVDLLLMMLGKKTFMVQIQKRISYGLEVLQYYTTKEWHFKNDNFVALRKVISKEDDETFYTDIKMINWSSYIRDYIYGARQYCCKEDPSSLPQARKLQKQLYYLDRVTTIIIYSLCAYFIYYYVRMFVSVMF
ncbi:putative fatty acyl-CoA reductase CG5065 [Leguminivora glycinivorella]|uniref:putative fatty acyl-CoA reductase CG5065 n=1 Tax=Leguminivora glycinivorella TaxID=1035111 RepID=UPI00200C7371|nr:putative fatty acyl-CoA reductase CG5065 [Leguminivora glycinivorella]